MKVLTSKNLQFFTLPLVLDSDKPGLVMTVERPVIPGSLRALPETPLVPPYSTLLSYFVISFELSNSYSNFNALEIKQIMSF